MKLLDKPKIAIVGYGRMGKEVEKVILNQNLELTMTFDKDNPLVTAKKYDFDVAILFDEPDSVLDNIEKLIWMKKKIVVGTTGWYDKINDIKSKVDDAGIALVWGSNFSIGMNIFFRIVKTAAMHMNQFDDYDIFTHEIHHTNKKDSPSGSAITIANIILDSVDKKEKIQSETVHDKISDNELHVSSTRGGSVAGTHIVYLDSDADYIRLAHNAKNRSGFAKGAVEAAKMSMHLTGMHEFKDLIFS